MFSRLINTHKGVYICSVLLEYFVLMKVDAACLWAWIPRRKVTVPAVMTLNWTADLGE